MLGRDEKSRLGRLGRVLLLLAILSAEDALAGETRLSPEGASSGSDLERKLGDAVRSASAKLAGASCRQVFTDFRDSSGRTLQQNLDALGHTGESYLALLLFYDGHGKSRCADRSTLASTSPGSRVIYVCSPQFVEKQRRDPGLAAALLIHEELHSLGLGERPPASQDITAQVVARCGRAESK